MTFSLIAVRRPGVRCTGGRYSCAAPGGADGALRDSPPASPAGCWRVAWRRSLVQRSARGRRCPTEPERDPQGRTRGGTAAGGRGRAPSRGQGHQVVIRAGHSGEGGTSWDDEEGEWERGAGKGGPWGAGKARGGCVGMSLVVQGAELDLNLLPALTRWARDADVRLFFPVRNLNLLRRGLLWGDGNRRGEPGPLKARRWQVPPAAGEEGQAAGQKTGQTAGQAAGLRGIQY